MERVASFATSERVRSGADNRPVAEFDFLRAVACLGVVGIHALTLSLGSAAMSHRTMLGMQAMQMLLMFSTPTFVMLSALLVGYAYDRPPDGFLRKRLRYVGVPFVSMCVVYAGVEILKARTAHSDVTSLAFHFLGETLHNLLGGNHLWFILPILQFYLLYRLFWRQVQRLRPGVLLAGAFVLNAIYLGYFNFAPAAPNAYSAMIGRHWYSVFFPAWVFYFALGLHAGGSFQRCRIVLPARLSALLIALALAGTVVLSVHFSGLIYDASSRRVDVLLYSPIVVATLLAIAARLGSVPRFFQHVSRYAFGIYLLHPLCLEVLWHLIVSLADVAARWLLVVLWIAGAAAAWAGTRLLAALPFGSLLVGRVRSDRPGALQQPVAVPRASRL